jgi:hypothetical protein
VGVSPSLIAQDPEMMREGGMGSFGTQRGGLKGMGMGPGGGGFGATKVFEPFYELNLTET